MNLLKSQFAAADTDDDGTPPPQKEKQEENDDDEEEGVTTVSPAAPAFSPSPSTPRTSKQQDTYTRRSRRAHDSAGDADDNDDDAPSQPSSSQPKVIHKTYRDANGHVKRSVHRIHGQLSMSESAVRLREQRRLAKEKAEKQAQKHRERPKRENNSAASPRRTAAKQQKRPAPAAAAAAAAEHATEGRSSGGGRPRRAALPPARYVPEKEEDEINDDDDNNVVKHIASSPPSSADPSSPVIERAADTVKKRKRVQLNNSSNNNNNNKSSPDQRDKKKQKLSDNPAAVRLRQKRLHKKLMRQHERNLALVDDGMEAPPPISSDNVNSSSTVDVHYEEAPVFHPTVEEFSDPFTYMRWVYEKAAPYGIARIVPPLRTHAARRVGRMFAYGTPQPQHGTGRGGGGAQKSPLKLQTKVQLVRPYHAESRQKTQAHAATSSAPAAAASASASTPKKKGRKNAIVSRRPNQRKAVPQQFRFAVGDVRSPAEYEARASNFARLHFGSVLATPSAGEVDAAYWTEMAQPIPTAATKIGWHESLDPSIVRCRVEYASDIPGSVFTTREVAVAEGDDLAASAWNLRDFGTQVANQSAAVAEAVPRTAAPPPPPPKQPQRQQPTSSKTTAKSSSPLSLFQFLDDDLPGITSPMLYVGMLFSTFAWHVEDHNLFSLNYLHAGAPKTWYGVPAESSNAFEAALHDDVYKMSADTPTLRAAELVARKNTMFAPSAVVRHGGKAFRTTQNAGEFVVTFPRAYHAGFSHGFNVAEAINFATPDWLSHGRESMVRNAMLSKVPILDQDRIVALYVMRWMRQLATAMSRECPEIFVGLLVPTGSAVVDSNGASASSASAAMAAANDFLHDALLEESLSTGVLAQLATLVMPSMTTDPRQVRNKYVQAFISRLDSMLVVGDSGGSGSLKLTPFGMGAADFLRSLRDNDENTRRLLSICDARRSREDGASTQTQTTTKLPTPFTVTRIDMPPSLSPDALPDASPTKPKWEFNPMLTACSICNQPCFHTSVMLHHHTVNDSAVPAACASTSSSAAPARSWQPCTQTFCAKHASNMLSSPESDVAYTSCLIATHPRLSLLQSAARVIESRLHSLGLLV